MAAKAGIESKSQHILGLFGSALFAQKKDVDLH